MTKTLAIVVSDFNQHITHALLEGALCQLQVEGIEKQDITVIHVPGAVEIPLAAKLLAKSKHFAAIICLGAVIRGETDHYLYVCEQVSQGCQQVMLTFEIPVIFGVLTTNTDEEALDRVGGKMGHKGKEAASAALSMLSVVHEIESYYRLCR